MSTDDKEWPKPPTMAEEAKVRTAIEHVTEHSPTELPAYLIGATRSRPMCGVCAGDGKPIAGVPCICGGVGTQDAEMDGLRKYAIELEAELQTVARDAAIAALVDAEYEAVIWKRIFRPSPRQVIDIVLNALREGRRVWNASAKKWEVRR